MYFTPPNLYLIRGFRLCSGQVRYPEAVYKWKGVGCERPIAAQMMGNREKAPCAFTWGVMR